MRFLDPDDWERIRLNDVLSIENVRKVILAGQTVEVINRSTNERYRTEHAMSSRQIKMVLAGSLINMVKQSLL